MTSAAGKAVGQWSVLALLLVLLLLAACAPARAPAISAPPVQPLCEVPTGQILRSTAGDSLGVFMATIPCGAH